MHEFTFGTSTKNGHFGAAACAFDKEISAGGSSGGSGACVRTGSAPIALSTDTIGSIRIPATCNGVVGYRPTISRWPSDYGINCTHLLDVVGPNAINMDDTILMDETVSGQRHKELVSPKDIRIGVPSYHYYEDLDPQV